MLTASPIELFMDCVGIVLIVIFSFGVTDDIARIWSRYR